MFVARLICSDPACLDEVEAEAPTLAELESFACECGCALAVIAWPDWVDDPAGELVTLHVAPPLSRAA